MNNNLLHIESQFHVHIKVLAIFWHALFTKCWQIVFKVGRCDGEEFHNYGIPFGDNKEEKKW